MGGHYKAPTVAAPEDTKDPTRPRPFRRDAPAFSGPGSLRGPKRARAARRRPITWKRVLLWLAIVIAGWLLLSFVLFVVSAQFEQDQVSDAPKNQLELGAHDEEHEREQQPA